MLLYKALLRPVLECSRHFWPLTFSCPSTFRENEFKLKENERGATRGIRGTESLSYESRLRACFFSLTEQRLTREIVVLYKYIEQGVSKCHGWKRNTYVKDMRTHGFKLAISKF